jgi:hypothetical protein
MADLLIHGRMTIASLKRQFKEQFHANLRVYDGNKFAADTATIASIRKDGAEKAGEVKLMSNMRVGNFEKKFLDTFGIRVQVATPDNSRLVDDSKTLKGAASVG